MNIGATIKLLREEMRLTQRQLATRLGVSHALIGHWENSRARPGIDDLPKIAAALDVPLSTVSLEMRLTSREMPLSIYELLEGRRRQALHGHSAPDGHDDGRNPTIAPPGGGQGDTAFGFWHARALGV